MVAQWFMRGDVPRSVARHASTYATVVTVAQIGWIAMIPASTSIVTTFAWAAALAAFEMFGPWLAERRMGVTSWHAHHIAERYSPAW